MEAQGIIANFRSIVTEHYFDFEGRARRSTFWYFVLAYLIIFIVLAIIQSIAHLPPVLTGLLAIGLLLPNLGLTVRRLHDTNHSGWWIFIALVPLIGFLLLLWWYCSAGTTGPNTYGADPKGVVA
jgi:uncharacterized membrane protein YhaH (DUF805 family)